MPDFKPNQSLESKDLPLPEQAGESLENQAELARQLELSDKILEGAYRDPVETLRQIKGWAERDIAQ